MLDAALTFASEYAGKRAISAIGHNFSGSFDSPVGTAADYMKHLAWSPELDEAIDSKIEPTLSLTTRFKIGDETASSVRLEPLAEDETRIFYDLNISWGRPGEPLPLPAEQIIGKYMDSVRAGGDLIARLAQLSERRD